MKKIISVLLSALLILLSVSLVSFEAFADDEILTSADGQWKYVVLGDGSAQIYGGAETPAYYGNDSDIVVPDSIDGHTVTSIGDFAFFMNDSAETITVGEHVTAIGVGCFAACSSLVAVSVVSANDSLYSIDGVLISAADNTLICYPGGKTDAQYTVPDCVEHIGTTSFAMCFNLESVYMPDTVESIDVAAFTMCTSLSEVRLSESLTEIPSSVFYACSSLTELTIPRSVAEISPYGFEDSGLTVIKGYIGTSAQSFADEHGYEFVSLDVTIRGDFNVDGEVTLADYTAFVQYLTSAPETELNALQLICADLDGDGAVDAFDLFFLDKLLNGNE